MTSTKSIRIVIFLEGDELLLYLGVKVYNISQFEKWRVVHEEG